LLFREIKLPRPNPAGNLDDEANVASRIALERERHGWSYESLAKLMTEMGVPLQGTAIFRIEKGRPRRSIKVNELVGFARVFEVEVSDMLQSPGEYWTPQVRAAWARYNRTRAALSVARAEHNLAEAELTGLGFSPGDAWLMEPEEARARGPEGSP
jgi:transcriptional regulator with XRE-family HTH domain